MCTQPKVHKTKSNNNNCKIKFMLTASSKLKLKLSLVTLKLYSIVHSTEYSRVRIFFIIIFVYCVFRVFFINYFRVCIFMYLLTINFVRVFSKYRVFVYYNKFHYQLRTNCTFYYIPCTCNYSIYFCYFIWICMYLCGVFHIFKCEYRSYAVRDQNVLREGEGGKTRQWKLC